VDRLQDADVAVFEQKSDIPPSPECPKEVFCIYIQGEDSEETNHHHLPESKLFSIGNEIFNGEAYKDFLVQSD
jgi:hypothetical protein